MTGLQEATVLGTTSISLALTAFALLALLQKRMWLTSLLCLFWLAWAFHIFTTELLFDPYFTAQEIGCIGSSLTYLTFGTFVCICVLTITLFLKRS